MDAVGIQIEYSLIERPPKWELPPMAGGPGLTIPDEASEVELGFPHDFYEKDTVRGFVYGGMRAKIDA